MADLTQFDLGSSQRIARVVRQVEQEPRRARPLGFERVDDFRIRPFRVCTFTGEWSIGAAKAVTFKYKTTTPNTVSAANLFFDYLPDKGEQDCAVAKEGTSWFLIQARQSTEDVTAVTTIQRSGNDIVADRISMRVLATATAESVTIAACCTATGGGSPSTSVTTITVITDASLSTSALTFTRATIGVLSQSSAGDVTIEVASCSTSDGGGGTTPGGGGNFFRYMPEGNPANAYCAEPNQPENYHNDNTPLSGPYDTQEECDGA